MNLEIPKSGRVNGEKLKLSLAFSHSKFVVPWITISSGNGHVLTDLTVTFLYSGSDLTQVKWNGEYSEAPVILEKESEANMAHKLKVKYEWNEVVEHDVESGLIFMCATTLVTALALLSWICLRNNDTPQADGRPLPGNKAKAR